ncbi:MAG: hypothetical protein DRP59_01055 [Spirochaetes bacterium]|nr:MAG: hypothetical protein DRP59_01055 [Spirochaetota bacterium]
MEISLYNKKNYDCVFTSGNTFSMHRYKNWSRIDPVDGDGVISFNLLLSGANWRILWPNREGELFHISQVQKSIEQYNVPEGLTISYPATASCRTIIFLEDTDRGVAVLAPPDTEGRVTELRIKSTGIKDCALLVTGNSCTWYAVRFDSLPELQSRLVDLKGSVSWKGIPLRNTEASWQVQTGLIGTDGHTSVPKERGFDVLSDISACMERLLGSGNILHVFGYAGGHDIGYPDYTPSPVLGGDERLGKAITEIHRNNQKVVFYLNGRIAQKELVDDTDLYDAVLTTEYGSPVVEVYQDREFYVMNPSSEKWLERITNEALHLKALGADGVQLDQLGGRAAVVPPGEIWGRGYIDLIETLHLQGLLVWIQGVSDIYPADWFELTYRNVSILEDGTIRGGTPLGKADKRLYELSVPNQVLLVPLSRFDKQWSNSKRIIVDLDKKGGELFLYNPRYLKQLEEIISKAVFKKGK